MGALLVVFLAVLAFSGGRRSPPPTIVGLVPGLQGSGSPTPPRLPTTPPPTTPSGSSQSSSATGRVWKTFAFKAETIGAQEMKLLRVANDPSNPAVGTGYVIADVYEQAETIGIAPYHGTPLCDATRYRLNFEAGRLVSWTDVGASGGADAPKCSAQSLPLEAALAKTIQFVQRGPDVFLQWRQRRGLYEGPIGNPNQWPDLLGRIEDDGGTFGPHSWRGAAVLVDVEWQFLT